MAATGVLAMGAATALMAAGVGTGYLPHGSNASDTAYLTPYAGLYDPISDSDQQEAAQFGLEYRHADIFYGLRPTLGVNVTTDSSLYGYAGVHWDVPILRDQLFIIPNFAVGMYSEGDGKDLGGTLEFRSGMELAYQFENKQRVGLAFNHISNANTYDRNPGAEAVLLTYSMPAW